MSGKKLPQDIDLASGFFSGTASKSNSSEEILEKITAPSLEKQTSIEDQAPTKEPASAEGQTPTEEPASNKRQKTSTIHKNLGGRPRKEGLKNQQFTLTMNPEVYEKLRIVAREHTRGNFSSLVDEAIKLFCQEYDIDLTSIEVDPQILAVYKERQEKRFKKK